MTQIKKGKRFLSLMLAFAQLIILLPIKTLVFSEGTDTLSTQTVPESVINADKIVDQYACDCTGTVPENIAYHADSCPRKQYIKSLFQNKTAKEIYGQWGIYNEETRADLLNMLSVWDKTKHDELKNLLDNVVIENQIVEATFGEIMGTASGNMPTGAQFVISNATQSPSVADLGLDKSQGQMITMLDLHIMYENAQWQPMDGGIEVSLKLDLSSYNPETHYLFAIHAVEREIDGKICVNYEYFTYGGHSNTLNYDDEASTVTFVMESFSNVYFTVAAKDAVSTNSAEPRYTDGSGTYWKFTTISNVFAMAGVGANPLIGSEMVVSIDNVAFTESDFGKSSGKPDILSGCNAMGITFYYSNCTFDFSTNQAGFQTRPAMNLGVKLRFERCKFPNKGIYGTNGGSANVDVTFISCEAPNSALLGGLAGDVYMEDCLNGSGINADNTLGTNSMGVLATFEMKNCKFTEEVMNQHWHHALYLNMWHSYTINNPGYVFYFYESTGDPSQGNTVYYRQFEKTASDNYAHDDLQHYQVSALNAFTPARIKYIGNGATGETTVAYSAPYAPGATATVDSNTFTRIEKVNGVDTNYVFTHWNTQPDGSGTNYNPSDKVTFTALGGFDIGQGAVGGLISGKLVVDPVVLYAQWEKGEPVYQETTLTIRVEGCNKTLDPGQSFLFTVVGSDGIQLRVTVPENNTVTIYGVTIGATYTVTMDKNWSWRYDIDKTSKEKVLAGTGNEFVFNVSREKQYWLSGSAYSSQIGGATR